jgi:hypothetical protein
LRGRPVRRFVPAAPIDDPVEDSLEESLDGPFDGREACVTNGGFPRGEVDAAQARTAPSRVLNTLAITGV